MAIEYINSGLLGNHKAYYRFESGALTTDSSGLSHSLTNISDPAEGVGRFGGGVVLDGNDAYSAVNHTDLRPTGHFTIGGWVKESVKGGGIFQSYSATDGKSGGVRLYILSSTGVARLLSGKNTGSTAGTDYQVVDGSKVLNDDVWHFLVGTYDGSKLHLYTDGVEEGSGVSWTNSAAYSATNYVNVGCTNIIGELAGFVTGSLDDVFLISGTALTSVQIAQMYFGGAKPLFFAQL